MDWITDQVAIGDIDDAMRSKELNSAGVTGVLSLNGYPTFLSEWGIAWKRVPLIDGPGNSTDDIACALATLTELLSEGHKVLVHCTEGVSRAPFVTACYLASTRKWNLDSALDFIAKKRPVVNPHPALRSLWPAECARHTRRSDP
jgi:histidinol-phosphate aminotransferase